MISLNLFDGIETFLALIPLFSCQCLQEFSLNSSLDPFDFFFIQRQGSWLSTMETHRSSMDFKSGLWGSHLTFIVMEFIPSIGKKKKKSFLCFGSLNRELHGQMKPVPKSLYSKGISSFNRTFKQSSDSCSSFSSVLRPHFQPRQPCAMSLPLSRYTMGS